MFQASGDLWVTPVLWRGQTCTVRRDLTGRVFAFLPCSAASQPPGGRVSFPSHALKITVCDAMWGEWWPWMEFTFFLNKKEILILKGREKDSSCGEDLLSKPPFKLLTIIPTFSVKKLRPRKVKTVSRGHGCHSDRTFRASSSVWLEPYRRWQRDSLLALGPQGKHLSMWGFSFVICRRKSVMPVFQILWGLNKLMWL